ncbi:MAG TPA: HYR domain-containing protein, partial [Thermoanaerobaculia bacterium]|nr:HYR domain-containing protein [Thermoanaerobaculia bacterium]
MAVLILFAALSAAAKIESIEPTSFVADSGEHFINIYGTELGDTVLFTGKAGEFKLEFSAVTERGVIAWVPQEVLSVPGRYILEAGGSQATFEVVTASSKHPLVVLVPDPIAKPAESRSGARVSFSVSTYGGGDPHPSVKCDHTSGDLFPLGASVVKCTASNILGETATGNVFVTVYDNTPPMLTLPQRIIIKAASREGTNVSFEATAFDAIDGQLPVTCDPKSGSLFPIGVNAVECSATDVSLNLAVGTFYIEVYEGDGGRLVMHLPDGVAAEAQGPDGSIVEFEATASGTSDPNPRVTCDPKSGSFFRFGV